MVTPAKWPPSVTGLTRACVSLVSTKGLWFNAPGDRAQGPPGPRARGVSFGVVEAITVDVAGNLYIGELTRVRRIDAATGKVVTIFDGSTSARVLLTSMLLAEADALYVTDWAGYVRRLQPDGRMDVIAGGGSGF
jgi:hypothetical protein